MCGSQSARIIRRNFNEIMASALSVSRQRGNVLRNFLTFNKVI